MYDEHRTTMGRVFAPMDGEDATRFWTDHETHVSRTALERDLLDRHGTEERDDWGLSMKLDRALEKLGSQPYRMNWNDDTIASHQTTAEALSGELKLDLTGCETVGDVYARLER